MEENKVTKINLSTLFLILAIIVIIIMGIFLYKLYNEKTQAISKSAELETQMQSLNETVSNLQETIDNVSNTNNLGENANNTSDENNVFTDEQIQESLSNYLELKSYADCDALLEALTEKGFLNYDSSKDTMQDDEWVLTTIKFSDYKNAMLNYVSENEFENKWNSTLYFSENSDGYLMKVQGGGSRRIYTIESITENSDCSYTAMTTYTIEDDNTIKENENFIFTIKSYNGKCVIDSI